MWPQTHLYIHKNLRLCSWRRRAAEPVSSKTQGTLTPAAVYELSLFSFKIFPTIP